MKMRRSSRVWDAIVLFGGLALAIWILYEIFCLFLTLAMEAGEPERREAVLAVRAAVPEETGADEAAFEEIAQRQPLLSRSRPAVVIGIADDKAREDEEKVYGNVGMIERSDDATAHVIGGLSKGKTLEDMVEQYENGRYAS